MRNPRGEDIKSILIKLASPEQMLNCDKNLFLKHKETKDFLYHRYDQHQLQLTGVKQVLTIAEHRSTVRPGPKIIHPFKAY